MSLSVPNLNDFIERIFLILSNSTLLFPQSVGGDESATDLVNQIIPYALPVPEQPIEGPGPPHIFIKEADSAFSRFNQIGRSSINVQGPEEAFLELYVVVVARGASYQDSQVQLFNIIQAVKQVLKSNMRLGDPTTNPPLQNTLCNLLETITVPWLIDSEEKTVIARNIIVRPKVFINLLS